MFFQKFRDWFTKPALRKKPSNRPRRGPSLQVENLEARWTPYSASGNAWLNPELVSLSFMPENTVLGQYADGSNITNDLPSAFLSEYGSHGNWQWPVVAAAQTWAYYTDLNFTVVSDNGASLGSGAYQQGDPNLGDIRIGGYNYGTDAVGDPIETLAQAYLPQPINNFSIAGDIVFNTGQAYGTNLANGDFDLYTVAMHEMGHALGLNHSEVFTANMWAYYTGVKYGLTWDDVYGGQAIYTARSHDAFDDTLGNNTSLQATDIESHIDDVSLTANINDLDITGVNDVDWYKFRLDDNATQFKVTAQSAGLSMLSPDLTVFDSLGNEIVSSSGYRGVTVSTDVPFTAADRGDWYYVRVQRNEYNVFGSGRYALTLNMGSGADPVVQLPNTQELNGNPISSGGGQAQTLSEETLINTTTEGSQRKVDVAVAGDGKSVVVWESTHDDRVYFQRLDETGAKVGTETSVDLSTYNQRDPSVGIADNGDFVIVWTDDDGNVSGSRFDFETGTNLGGMFQVNTDTSGIMYKPDVAMSDDGEFVVTWTQTSGLDVRARVFDAQGAPQGNDFVVNSTTYHLQEEPAVAIDDVGNFVIVWDSYGQDGSSRGVYGQRFDPTGTPLGAEIQVNTYTRSSQDDADVAMDANGNFVVVWESWGQDGSANGVYGQRFSSNGSKLGTEFVVNEYTLMSQGEAAIAMDSNGNFIVAWESYGQDGSWDGIYMRQYTAGGQLVGQETLVNSTTYGSQVYPAVGLSDNGFAVVTWTGYGSGDSSGVFAQTYAVFEGAGMSNTGTDPEYIPPPDDNNDPIDEIFSNPEWINGDGLDLGELW
ncbi:MAG: matrixin family metalloprotease [Gemmataceae bacterium]